MDPFLLGYSVLAIVVGLGYWVERCSWSKPLAVLCCLVLLINSLLALAKTILHGQF